jgi:hypothetical protein
MQFSWEHDYYLININHRSLRYPILTRIKTKDPRLRKWTDFMNGASKTRRIMFMGWLQTLGSTLVCIESWLARGSEKELLISLCLPSFFHKESHVSVCVSQSQRPPRRHFPIAFPWFSHYFHFHLTLNSLDPKVQLPDADALKAGDHEVFVFFFLAITKN